MMDDDFGDRLLAQDRGQGHLGIEHGGHFPAMFETCKNGFAPAQAEAKINVLKSGVKNSTGQEIECPRHQPAPKGVVSRPFRAEYKCVSAKLWNKFPEFRWNTLAVGVEKENERATGAKIKSAGCLCEPFFLGGANDVEEGPSLLEIGENFPGAVSAAPLFNQKLRTFREVAVHDFDNLGNNALDSFGFVVDGHED